MLSRKDWERIQSHLAPIESEKNAHEDERKRLHEISVKETAGWNGTVEVGYKFLFTDALILFTKP